MSTQEFTTRSAEETVALGRKLAAMLAPPKLVLLRGELGAGKTTLVKGIAEGFDAASEEDVTSPTFTLVHEYRAPSVNLYHIDLYRVDTERELETLALDDLMAENSVLLIEWGRSSHTWSASGMWKSLWSGWERAGGGSNLLSVESVDRGVFLLSTFGAWTKLRIRDLQLPVCY